MRAVFPPDALPGTMTTGARLQAGWRDFDALAPVQPGRVTLLAGSWETCLDLAAALVADAAAQDRDVHVAAWKDAPFSRLHAARGLPAPHLARAIAAWEKADPSRVPGLLVLVGLPRGRFGEDALDALGRLARRLDAPALVVDASGPPPGALEARVDETVIAWREAGALHLHFPRRGARFLAPAFAGASA